MGIEAHDVEDGMRGAVRLLLYVEHVVRLLVGKSCDVLRLGLGDADDKRTTDLRQRKELAVISAFSADLLRWLWLQSWRRIRSHHGGQHVRGRNYSCGNDAARGLRQ